MRLENNLIGFRSSGTTAGRLSKQNSNTAAAGIAICVVIVAAIASLGYFQFAYAPSVFTTTSTATTQSGPVGGHYTNVTIVLGASGQGNAKGYFFPDNITVVLGVNSSVLWTNNDTAIHTVTSYGSIGTMSSPDLNPVGNSGNTFAFTFTSPGDYQYHCTIHPWMEGSVTVLPAPSSTSTTSSS